MLIRQSSKSTAVKIAYPRNTNIMGKVHKENGQDNDEKGFQFESEPASEHEFDGSRSSSNYAHWRVHVSFPGLLVRYQDLTKQREVVVCVAFSCSLKNNRGCRCCGLLSRMNCPASACTATERHWPILVATPLWSPGKATAHWPCLSRGIDIHPHQCLVLDEAYRKWGWFSRRLNSCNIDSGISPHLHLHYHCSYTENDSESTIIK